MSALTRICAIRGLQSGLNRFTRPNFVCRAITTSPKKSESTKAPTTSTTECVAQKENTWISYGFSYRSQKEDRFIMHIVFFFCVTVCIVFGGTAVVYKPKNTLGDWSQREAYLQLRYREEHGLPLIDPNFVPIDKINLPSDEELGDTDIVI